MGEQNALMDLEIILWTGSYSVDFEIKWIKKRQNSTTDSFKIRTENNQILKFLLGYSYLLLEIDLCILFKRFRHKNCHFIIIWSKNNKPIREYLGGGNRTSCPQSPHPPPQVPTAMFFFFFGSWHRLKTSGHFHLTIIL